MTPLAAWLTIALACQEALDWVGTRTPRDAWEDCPQGDWLLWVCCAAGVPPRRVIHAAVRVFLDAGVRHAAEIAAAFRATERVAPPLVAALEVEYRTNGDVVPILFLAHAVDGFAEARSDHSARLASRWAEAAVRHLGVASAASSVRDALDLEEVELRTPPLLTED